MHHLYGHHADVESVTLPQLLRCHLLRHLRSTDGRLDNRGARLKDDKTDAQEEALRAAARGNALMGHRARGSRLRIKIISRC